MNFKALVESALEERFNPYNNDQDNPFNNINLDEVCYFDTETTGLQPKNNQIVELAAKLGSQEFYAKIHLTKETLERIQLQSIKPPMRKDGTPSRTIEDLLAMSGYRSGTTSTVTEQQALIDFELFVKDAKVLVAHNASFDMNMINRRRRHYDMFPMERKKVWDTRVLSSKFMIPTLLAIENDEHSNQDKQKAKTMLDVLTTKFNKVGERDKISSSLGDLSKSILGGIKGWHQAMADVNTLKSIVEDFLINFFSEHYNSGVTNTNAFKKHFGKERKRDIMYKR